MDRVIKDLNEHQDKLDSADNWFDANLSHINWEAEQILCNAELLAEVTNMPLDIAKVISNFMMECPEKRPDSTEAIALHMMYKFSQDLIECESIRELAVEKVKEQE